MQKKIKIADIQLYIDYGSIEYLGTVNDVRFYIKRCCLCLLSYRECLPMSIMEEQATGRKVITSNGIGCKDTVENEVHGFLIPIKNVDAMVEKFIWILENHGKVQEMGKNARQFAEEHAVVEHDNVIEDYVHISPNVALGGMVRVGECTHIGIGASVKNNISICGNSIIGVGTTVVKNILQQGVYMGVAAKLYK